MAQISSRAALEFVAGRSLRNTGSLEELYQKPWFLFQVFTINLGQGSTHQVPNHFQEDAKKIQKIALWAFLFVVTQIVFMSIRSLSNILQTLDNEKSVSTPLNNLLSIFIKINTEFMFTFAPPILHMSFSKSYKLKIVKFAKKIKCPFLKLE